MVVLPDGGQLRPMMKVIKRAQNGFEDALYPYVFQITKPYISLSFNTRFRDIQAVSKKKPWYKFWQS